MKLQRHIKKFISIYTLFSFFIVLTFYLSQDPDPPNIPRISPLNELTQSDHFVNIPPPTCRDTRTFRRGLVTKICVKPVETDIWISGAILKSGAWEFDFVNRVVRGLHHFKNATFVDIGCNIGMYTVVVAAMGRRVVAVDADPVNLAYVRHSLEVANTTERVRIVYNSVSNDHTVLYPVSLDPKNGGSTNMKTENQMKLNNLEASGPPIASITLMDILDTISSDTVILKLDIEGYECKALTPDVLAGKSGKKIPMIFLEWSRIPKVNCPEIKDWSGLFYKGGYLPYHPGSLQHISDEDINKQGTLLWVQKTVTILTNKNGYSYLGPSNP